MGFNLNNFINTTSQSIANRALSTVTSKVDNVLGGGGVAGLLSGILSSGASAQSLLSIASLGADKLINNLESEFFGAIGLGGASKSRLPSNLLKDTSLINKLGAGSSKLQFPPDLGVYGISFTFAKYHRPSPLVKSDDTITTAIYLPLPRELITKHEIDYTTQSGGTVTGVADAAYQSIGGTVEGGSKRAGIIAGISAVGTTTGIVDGFTGASTAATLGQVLGAVENPNITVSYAGPTLRSFSFSWTFSPNNAKESDTLVTIFNEIYKRSLGGFTEEGSSAILSYPESVNVHVFPKGRGMIGDLMQFKKSVIKSIVVNNSPNNIPSFFKGTQSPTFFDVHLDIQEIEYFVSADYDGSNNNGFSSDVHKIGEFAVKQTGALGAALAPLGSALKGFDGNSFASLKGTSPAESG
jgi:hypothetical protein